jgi:hypothetical protein
MHRNIIFSGEPPILDRLADELRKQDEVISVARVPGASLKPAGDVLTVFVLNRGADEVMRRADAGIRGGRITASISASTALLDGPNQDRIARDADEAMWEEMEADLRNVGGLAANYLVLMALGGALAGAAFFTARLLHPILFVGASIVAPGFEPLAKIGHGLVLKQWRSAGRGAWSAAFGYLVLVLSAALVTLVLSAFGEASAELLRTSETPNLVVAIDARSLAVSAFACVAGLIMIVSLRDFYVVGALLLLVLIPGAALIGAAAALGEWRLAGEAALRCGIDSLFVVAAAIGVYTWKQWRFHRRQPVS